MKNIFKNTDFSLEEEKIEEFYVTKSFRVERILSSGQRSVEWYDQEEDEVVILLKGNAKILYENNRIFSLEKGDSIFIPKHQKHKVIYTSEKCVWICIFEHKK